MESLVASPVGRGGVGASAEAVAKTEYEAPTPLCQLRAHIFLRYCVDVVAELAERYNAATPTQVARILACSCNPAPRIDHGPAFLASSSTLPPPGILLHLASGTIFVSTTISCTSCIMAMVTRMLMSVAGPHTPAASDESGAGGPKGGARSRGAADPRVAPCLTTLRLASALAFPRGNGVSPRLPGAAHARAMMQQIGSRSALSAYQPMRQSMPSRCEWSYRAATAMFPIPHGR